MATTVESRECKNCGTLYRTKVKKGRDTKQCPGCEDPAPVQVARDPVVVTVDDLVLP